MANYINENILCQAYIHVKSREDIDEQVLLECLQDFVRTRASHFLYPEANTNVEIKEGSIKLYVTILGTVATLFQGFSAYPSFREGAITLHEDVKMLSEYINSEGLYQTSAKHNQVIRVEARTGVLGSIRKIISMYDKTLASNGYVHATTLTKQLFEIESEIQKLIENLYSNEDVALIKNGFSEMTLNLPTSPKRQQGKQPSSQQDIDAYKEQLEKLKSMLD